jgi:acetyl-CoA carboxylase carboxyltransferase component
MEAQLAEIHALTGQAVAGGEARYVDRHRARGRLLARERVDALLDRHGAFLELSPLAGYGTDDPLGAGVVTGIGVVTGVECVIVANDPTVRGGSMSPTTVRKILRAIDIAHTNSLPLIQLVESGGADLPKQADIFVPGGSIFKAISRLSAARIPTIATVFGSSTAGGAYVPGMSDYTIMVDGQARVFLGGPPLVKMAIDEDADEEQLGGAQMHSRTSGVSDYLARDERHALQLTRDVLARLGWTKKGPSPVPVVELPAYPAEELLGIPSANPKDPYDIRDVIARIVDGSGFDEFKPLYGAMLVTGWARLHGYEVGIIANNGILFSEEAQKGAQFIQLCNQVDRPILFIQNITGFMVGSRAEHGGIIKDGAKMVNAVANSVVPKITVFVGNSYGAGNYAMCGKAYGARFLFAWPSASIAVMGGEQASKTLLSIQLGRREDVPEAEKAELLRTIQERYARSMDPRYAAARLWVDGIVDPARTREVVSACLDVCAMNAEMPEFKTGVLQT